MVSSVNTAANISLIRSNIVPNRLILILHWLSDLPSKTATGTIAIQVEDFNDHCPTLTSKTQTMCLQDSVIYVTAVDEDHFPNSSPFEFTVVEEGTTGKWRVEHFNGNAM